MKSSVWTFPPLAAQLQLTIGRPLSLPASFCVGSRSTKLTKPPRSIRTKWQIFKYSTFEHIHMFESRWYKAFCLSGFEAKAVTNWRVCRHQMRSKRAWQSVPFKLIIQWWSLINIIIDHDRTLAWKGKATKRDMDWCHTDSYCKGRPISDVQKSLFCKDVALLPWLHSSAGKRCGELAQVGIPRTWPKNI